MKSMFARYGIRGQLVRSNIAVRKSRVQQLRRGMGDQVDDFEPDLSIVERPKRSRGSDYEEHAEEGEHRVLRPIHGATGIQKRSRCWYVVLTSTDADEQ